MPDRLWNKGKSRRLYRSKRKGITNQRTSMFLTKCVLAMLLVIMVWVGVKITPVREYLTYVFVPGASAQSPWAQWFDWQPSNELVQPVWVILTGRQDSVEYDLPLEGQVMAAYGWTTDAVSNQPTYNEGIKIAAPVGTMVQSILPGTVAEADAASGTIQIDHGSEMKSVYRGCTDLLVKVGDRVKLRDALGRLGQSGELYFALYQAGKPQDPLLKTREGVR